MNRGDVQTILRILRTEWPQSFRGMDREDGEAKLSLWTELFSADDPLLVGAAVKALIVAGNREFAPTAGVIKEEMRKLTAPEEPDEAAVWNRIRAAVSNGLYGAREEFEKLPPPLQKLVGSPAQLRTWAQLDSEELQTVVASNVQRAWRTAKSRERELRLLPPETAELVTRLAATMRLPDKTERNGTAKRTKKEA